jgi:MtN3 and saliva related transmembrane protein
MPAYLTETIGAIAATLTTLCWLPQTLQIIKTKETKAISLSSQALFATGVCLWLIYGVLIVSWPIIGANVATLALLTIIITLKLRHG